MAKAPLEIRKLVERFKEHREEYLSGTYKEEQVCAEFILPMFEALGWDISNKQGSSEAYKEVIHHDSIKSGVGTKAPDYCFRIGGVRKFFLEAKKPSVDIKDDVSPAYQLRRYAWSAKLPLGILTDFEEFAVYGCLAKPAKTDKASTARILYLTHDQFLDRWDEIAGVFSKDAILKGSFDRYAATTKGRRGTEGVDDAFLEEIERWRKLLAQNVAQHKRRLGVRELNFVVQSIIDRIIFLRICEDLGFESYGQMMALQNGPHVYDRLLDIFRHADQRYNSGLFHFAEEHGRATPPDMLTPQLKIDDDVLRDIFKNLYYPQSPYEFSVIPTEILGQVYERFLGKVIHLTPTRRAVIEEKPEVRKAGGVYYTPSYIVDYIVRNTVGKLLEGKTPKEASRLRILDPACGSGSFLIGAYQALLKWHLDWYVNHDPKRWASGKKPALFRDKSGHWSLTIDEQRRILTDNIYGVDIDPQAVEVTKLSLLLKLLESRRQGEMFREHALPDLGANIKCGNSLIGPEFYKGKQMSMLGDDERTRINIFDWHQEFATIMKDGGFDAVIGNPPYVRSINLKKSNPVLWSIYRSLYKAASTREWDIYLIFVEKGLGLLNKSGKLGYILPNKFLNSQVGKNLRTILSEGNCLERLVHFGAFQIFHGATTYTCLLFLDSRGKDRAGVARYIGPMNESGGSCPLPEVRPSLWHITEIVASELKAAAWEFAATSGPLLEKLKQWHGLESIAQVFQGTGTRADKVYMVENRGRKGKLIRIYSTEKEAEYLLESTFLKPVLRGRSIGRYEIADKNLSLIVPYEVIGGKSNLVQQKKLVALAPKTFKYLNDCKPRLDEREKGRFKGEGWYCYGRPQNLDRFDVPEKIVLPDVANRGTCFLDREGMWLLDTAYAIVRKANAEFDLRYLLAILNSPLLTCFLKETGSALRGGYFRMKTAYLNPFPIRTINFSERDDKTKHDQIVILVDQMLALKLKVKNAKTPHEKTTLDRQIAATDRQIDQLVYELYGLTEEEIRIVEKS